jgi:hypothetical protein
MTEDERIKHLKKVVADGRLLLHQDEVIEVVPDPETKLHSLFGIRRDGCGGHCTQVSNLFARTSFTPNSEAHANLMAAAFNDFEWVLKRLEVYRWAMLKTNEEVQQILGKVLNYPWFKDDQKNFPGATEQHGVCVGDHVTETIAEEAAAKIRALEAELTELKGRR